MALGCGLFHLYMAAANYQSSGWAVGSRRDESKNRWDLPFKVPLKVFKYLLNVFGKGYLVQSLMGGCATNKGKPGILKKYEESYTDN